MKIQLETGQIIEMDDNATEADIHDVVDHLAASSKMLSKSKPNVLEDVGKSALQGIREGITAPFDLGAMVGNFAVNKLTGNESEAPIVGSMLDTVGLNHTPETTAGEYVRTIGSFLPMGMGGTGSIAARVGRQVLAPAIVSETAGQATKGTEAEPFARIGGAIAGGQLVDGLSKLAGVAGDVAENFLRPFTQSGREKIVSDILKNAAQDPQAAIQKLKDARVLITAKNAVGQDVSSVPTVAEATGDIGLTALQKSVKTENPVPFANRVSEQNTARNLLLDTMAKSDAEFEAAKTARDAATAPMREKAFVRSDNGVKKAEILNDVDALSNQINSHNKLRSLNSPLAPSIKETKALQSNMMKKALDYLSIYEPKAQPLNSGFLVEKLTKELSTPQASRQSVEQAINWVSKRLGNKTDARSIYEVRKDINDAMQGKYSGELANLKLAKSTLKDLKNSLDDAIESSAPGFKAYLGKYTNASRPINHMEILRDIKQNTMLAAPDLASGFDTISQPKWSNMVQKNRAELAKTLPKAHLDKLDAITADLDRGTALSAAGLKAVGSDTMQNASMAKVLGMALEKGTSIPVFGGFLKWTQELTKQQTQQLLTDAMLNPEIAAQLMQKYTKSGAASLDFNLKQIAKNTLKDTVKYTPSSAQDRYKNIPRIEIRPNQ